MFDHRFYLAIVWSHGNHKDYEQFRFISFKYLDDVIVNDMMAKQTLYLS